MSKPLTTDRRSQSSQGAKSYGQNKVVRLVSLRLCSYAPKICARSDSQKKAVATGPPISLALEQHTTRSGWPVEGICRRKGAPVLSHVANQMPTIELPRAAGPVLKKSGLCLPLVVWGAGSLSPLHRGESYPMRRK